MNIVNKKIQEIKPYENNPRKNEKAVKYVSNSIKEFGFKVPIIIDKNNVIVVGHTRFKAARKLKLTEIPCIVAEDLTEEQIKAFRLADNKVSEKAEWNFELLEEELANILDLDMEDFGFDLETEEDKGKMEMLEDEVPEIKEEPKTKYGDIYQLGNHKLMCGDATKEDNVLKLMDGNIADIVFTDPPYGINVVKSSKVGGNNVSHFGKIGGGRVVKSKTYKEIVGDNSTNTAKLSYKIIKNISKNQIIFGGNYFTNFLYPSKCWIVWDKQNTGNFADVELAWTSFEKCAKLYSWLWNGMSRKGAHKIEGKTRVHPTQKPVGLIENILGEFTEENNIILDVFGGSGSTLIACEQIKRNCYMMEIEPIYCDVIIKRWEELTNEKAVLLKD